MRKLIASIALCALCTASLKADDSQSPLTIEMSDPQVRITIPGMHGIEMSIPPENQQDPDFKLRGSSDTTAIYISTPKISNTISPTACATAVANAALSHPSVTREQMFLGRSNEHTFLIIYGLPVDEAVMLNTHIVSAGPTQCIEAHVSKISSHDTDIEPWFNGFSESNIETY